MVLASRATMITAFANVSSPRTTVRVIFEGLRNRLRMMLMPPKRM